ncbi:MAG: M3 family oligoendopeptidase [Planctomycetota bacterium]|jgi:M3 family oligoendopeptidase|nr:M3 family oligoendopeptidase [Planctomycetota bacterium]
MTSPTETTFHDMQSQEPSLDKLREQFDDITRLLQNSDDASQCTQAIQSWDKLRGQVATWSAMAHLHFNQDTGNESYRKGRETADALMPDYTNLEIGVKRALVSSPHREHLEKQLSLRHAFDLWKCDDAAFHPDIREELVHENELIASYIELLGGARIPLGGKTCGISDLIGLQSGSDRVKRHEAARAMWNWFEENRPQLDQIFDDIVTLRDKMAKSLGRANFVEVGYDRKRRVDYDRHDVERFREQVLADVVPLACQLADRQAATLGIDKLKSWDEKVHRPQGAPAPRGDAKWMTDRASEMFDAIHPELADFYRLMVRNELMDLESRPGKAFGGFCTWFPDFGVPYVFANFNGTPGDARVFTHEIGHAFQRYKSRDNAVLDYVGCTSESAEVHSMSLEFLCWPEMERFFGEDANDFRMQHLAEQLMFLPYGVAVDHFQHLIYEQPKATPGERHAMWKKLEKMYMPWRDYGDLSHPGQGGYWQYQRHIYAYPFYYIDYTLAATCALQFWSRAQSDRDGALTAYVDLCKRGGSLPFRKLVESAGLLSPFEEGCLQEVVANAKRELAL